MTNRTATPATFAQTTEAAVEFLAEKFGIEALRAAGPERVAAAVLRLIDGAIDRNIVTITD